MKPKLGCESCERGVRAYLQRSSSATKRRNSCAAGMRSDASLFHHGARNQTSMRSENKLCCPACWLVPGQEFVCAALRRGGRVRQSDDGASVQRSDQLLTADELRQVWDTVHLADLTVDHTAVRL